MKQSTYNEMEKRARDYFKKAGIVVREDEAVEVSDFGLDQVEEIGLQLCVYINTERVCAKEMVLFPYQTCPEHKHVETNGMEGKEETFRCRYGKVYLYVAGEGQKENIQAKLPAMDTTVYHEIILNPVEVSSEKIREAIKTGESISGYVPEKVKDYILTCGLYL